MVVATDRILAIRFLVDFYRKLVTEDLHPTLQIHRVRAHGGRCLFDSLSVARVGSEVLFYGGEVRFNDRFAGTAAACCAEGDPVGGAFRVECL